MADEEGNRQGYGHACAACRHRKRKCKPNCELAKYFPADNVAKFNRINRRHGIKNVIQMLSRVPEDQRDAVIETLDKEAQIRIENPVHGCLGKIESLKHAIALHEAELIATKRLISEFRAHTNLNTSSHQQQLYHQMAALQNVQRLHLSSLAGTSTVVGTSTHQQPYHQTASVQNVQGLDLSMPDSDTVAGWSTVAAGTSTHQQGRRQQLYHHMPSPQDVYGRDIASSMMPTTVALAVRSTVAGTSTHQQLDPQMASSQNVHGRDIASYMMPDTDTVGGGSSAVGTFTYLGLQQLDHQMPAFQHVQGLDLSQMSSANTQRSSLDPAIEHLFFPPHHQDDLANVQGLNLSQMAPLPSANTLHSSLSAIVQGPNLSQMAPLEDQQAAPLSSTLRSSLHEIEQFLFDESDFPPDHQHELD